MTIHPREQTQTAATPPDRGMGWGIPVIVIAGVALAGLFAYKSMEDHSGTTTVPDGPVQPVRAGSDRCHDAIAGSSGRHAISHSLPHRDAPGPSGLGRRDHSANHWRKITQFWAYVGLMDINSYRRCWCHRRRTRAPAQLATVGRGKSSVSPFRSIGLYRPGRWWRLPSLCTLPR